MSPAPEVELEDGVDTEPSAAIVVDDDQLPTAVLPAAMLPELSVAAGTVVIAGSVSAEKLVAPSPPPQAISPARALVTVARKRRIQVRIAETRAHVT